MKPLLAALAVASLVSLSGTAFADCAASTKASDAKACLAQDLRNSDDRINAVYKLLMASRDDAAKIALRNEQRAWLKQRDSMCRLDNKETDREKWLQAILSDETKTLCVVRYTFARATALNDQLPKTTNAAALPDAPRAPKTAGDPAVGAAPPNTKFTDDGYMIVSTDTHLKGKWYFEVRFDRGRLAALGDYLFESGYHSADDHGVLKEIPIRHKAAGEPPFILGFAIDLDNGGSYARIDGNWDEVPGSNADIPTKLGTPYHMWLAGSSPLGHLLQLGLIKVNLGDQPFAYTMPDGYRPFTAR
jgi:uncharacterized protein YecT (DUF1311 family)